MAVAQVKAGDLLGGKYRVERVLGTGGMGMVVAARHAQLGQRVAVKLMLKEALADPGNAERFAREARAAVRLQSAHTARVLDVGKLKNGEPFMVMEYLDGQDLDEVVRANGPLTPKVAVGYILQACEAFAEAHGLGMIHRDIKLKNMFLARSVDGRPLVKVLDFGLAKTVGALGDVSLTATSAVFGSPQYMSPEQMRSAKDVDARSDVWSIGVSLYELLTARVPFDAPGVAEICAMVLKDPVEPPSKWAVGLPPELDAVVVKCLAKNPQDRYQSVAELAFALEPWSAMDGSAERILHVMSSAQKVDVPTLVDERSSADAHAKTLDAWDSGDASKGAKLRPRVVWMLGGLVAVCAVGLLAIAAVAVGPDKRHESPVASPVPVPVDVSPPLAATAEPAPSPPAVSAVVAPEPAPKEPEPAATLSPRAKPPPAPPAHPPTPTVAPKPAAVAKSPTTPAPKPAASTKPVSAVPPRMDAR
jgi:serine/threonine-protein kinase